MFQFAVNLFSFAGDLVDLPSLEQVPAPGPVTHIGEALLNVLRGAQSGAIAAVVLVSDGADNSADFDAAKIAEIASFGVPVHTVGVGAETMPNDLELEDVQLPSVGLAGSTVSAQVSIRHSGPALAQLKIYDGVTEQILQLWLLKAKEKMIVAFLDAADIKHDGKGQVEDLPETLSDKQVKEGIEAMLKDHPAEHVSLYLHVFQLQRKDGWPSVAKALEKNDELRLAPAAA